MSSPVIINGPHGAERLRFGVLLDHQYSKRDTVSLGDRVAELIDTAQATRDLGYDSLFVLHHYIAPLRTLQPLALLSHLLQHTGRMQVGTGILILPMIHPVHYAEELATIDQLSGGRLVLGVGAGYRDTEFDAFGIDRTHRLGRLWEGLEIIERLWSGESLTFQGKHFQLEDVECSVLPAQQPRPPIWVGSGGPKTIQKIGEKGYSWVVSSSAKARWAKGNLASHLEQRAAAGFTGPHTAALHRDLWLGDDEQSAFDEVKEHVSASAREYAGFGMDWLQADFEDRSLKAGLFGSPEEVAAQIRDYAEAGFDHFVFRVQWLGLPVERSIAMLQRFQDEVVPLLASSPIDVTIG
ncbi:MAG: LLM class flavin-dependent oxidoreductase [Patulibacter sp.]